jgi:mRNA interferase MazF
VWIVDLGMAAKVRPCLVLSIPTDPQDRVLVTVVPHTTSVQGTRFEVDIPKSFLKTGAFDAQQVVTVAQARLIRKIGDLTPTELAQVEDAVRRWLGL